MKAIIIPYFGCPPSALEIKEVPTPKASPGHALIQVHAFGINHAEMHMRRGEWAEAMPISGIECVGIIVSCPSDEYQPGDKVAAIMGGMGRSINGSYAEYTSVPVSNIAKIDSELGWAEMAAIPESYATAWTVLFRNLELKQGQKILIRGATSALGRAAVNLAVHKGGAEVWATTRSEQKREALLKLAVKDVIIERSDMSELLKSKDIVFDAVLNLVGNSVLLDSLKIPRRGGRLCLAGFLGGLDPIPEFDPLLQMASGVHFSFFGSFVFGTPEFPVSDVPMQGIMEDVREGRWNAKPAHVFGFEEIGKAHELMESGRAEGKMVVVI